MIRIHYADTEEEARERHESIVKRLEELGHQQVVALMATGGFPTQWNPIVTDWLKGK